MKTYYVKTYTARGAFHSDLYTDDLSEAFQFCKSWVDNPYKCAHIYKADTRYGLFNYIEKCNSIPLPELIEAFGEITFTDDPRELRRKVG